MTKDVLLAIRGLQFDAAEDETNVETITPARYYEKDGFHYVFFDEVTEGYEEPTHNRIRFQNKTMELTKKGLVNVHMIFEENEKNLTDYATPFGSIMIGIDAGRVAVTETEKEISILVDYVLDVNYEYLADCKINIRIMAKPT